MTNLEIALKYRARGWSIIPIKNGTKIPAIPSWTKYQTKIATEAEIKAWFMLDNNMGLALVCGEVSGVIAVDIDKKNGGDETARLLKLPPTLVSNTGGGGNHYLYKWRKGLVPPKVGLYPGIDIRSDRSYIVLPPTIHSSGKAYEWALDDDMELTEAPDWLEEKNVPKEQTDWNKKFMEKNGKGLRNMNSTQIAGKILYDTSVEMWDILGLPFFKTWNKEYNNPPLGEKELMTVWNSIKAKHNRNNPLEPEEKAEGEEDKEKEEDLPPEEEEKLIVKSFLKNKTKGTYDLANYLTNKFNIITVGEKEREMFVYRNGMYFRAENEIIFPEIQRILKHHTTKNAKTEAFHKIADMTSFPRSVFESAQLEYIPLANGVYDMTSKTLLPHDPKYRFTYQFPIVFDANATCPKTLKFFEQVFVDWQILMAQEWIGYYFYRQYMFKKAVVFVGEGDTGKTTLLEVITFLLGRENISAVSLQKMTGDKFAASQLYGKHGNLVDELSAQDIKDTGNFKVATGGGSMAGEYKFGNQFLFHNFSKLTFACNKIPDVTDFDDEAYFNRWMVARFEKIITDKIPNFIKTLTTEEERSGLFNWVMLGLDRLLAQGGFTYAKTAMDTKIEMMRSGSSIAVFCADCLVQQVGAEITKEEMYEVYVDYCTDTESSAETMKMFGMKFPFYVSYASEGNIDVVKYGKTTRARGWRNVVVRKSERQQREKDVAEKDYEEFGKKPSDVLPPPFVQVLLPVVNDKEVEKKVYAENEIDPDSIPF